MSGTSKNFGSIGAVMIAEERMRQVYGEGFWPSHDEQLEIGDLANFACCYALDPKGGDASNIIKILNPGWELKISCNENSKENIPGRIRDLTKAGALIAAEIDKLMVLGK